MIERREFLIRSATGIAASALASPGLARGSNVALNMSSYLRPLVARKDYSGFVILERDGRTLVSGGFGFVDDSRRIPHTPDTHYASASVGKMFTRAAVLQLEKAGKLNRSDSLVRYFPSVAAWSPINVGNLVDHKSGLARDFPPDTDLKKQRSLDEIAAIVAAMPIESKPGQAAAYSNNGYRLLAKIIEVAGGGPFDALIRELVFEPRGMRDTVPNIAPISVRRVAKGFRPGAGWATKVPAIGFNFSNERGAGSFLITPADMLKFVKTLPLEPADLNESSTKDADGRPKPRGAGHDGFGDGFAHLTYAYPSEQAYMVSLSNMQTGVFTPMHVDLRRLMFGEIVQAPAVPNARGSVSTADWSNFVGDYDLRPGNPVRIRRSGDLLTVDGGDGAHPLIPLGGARFFMRLRYATIVFEGDAGRPATLLRWAEGGGAFPLKRLG